MKKSQRKLNQPGPPAKKVLQEIEDLNTFYLREGTMKLKNLATSREIKIIVKYGTVERVEF